MLHGSGVDVFQIIELCVIMRQPVDVSEVHSLPASRFEDGHVRAIRQPLVNLVGERIRQRIRRCFRERTDQSAVL